MSDPIQAAAQPLHHWLRLHNPDWDDEQYVVIARAVVAAYLKAFDMKAHAESYDEEHQAGAFLLASDLAIALAGGD